MSVPTANPLYNTSNFLNTAFSIAQNGIFLKITFASPLSVSFQLNEKLFNIKYSDLGANFVDLGEFDWGILTVNYALCTSPAAGSRQAWIDAVIALITNGGVTPYVPSLVTSAQSNSVVGFNSATNQFTDLGPAAQQRLLVNKNSAQTFPTGAGSATACLFNVVVDDPLSGYNAATGTYTTPNSQGYYIMGFNLVYAGSSATSAYLQVNGTQVDLCISATGPLWGSFGSWLLPNSTIRVMIYATGGGSSISTSQPNNFWVKRIV